MLYELLSIGSDHKITITLTPRECKMLTDLIDSIEMQSNKGFNIDESTRNMIHKIKHGEFAVKSKPGN